MVKVLTHLKQRFLIYTIGISMTFGTSCMAFAAQSDVSCDAFKTLVTQSIEANVNKIPITQQLTQSIPPETRAVFIAEHHYDEEANAHEAEIVTALHDSHGFDCLFIEMPEGFGVFPNLKPTPRGLKFAQSQISWLSNVYDFFPIHLLKGWLPAAFAAKKAGMKVFEFDQRRRDTDLETMMERNKTMTRNFLKTLASGQCHKGIMLNGFFHDLIEAKSGDLTSLPTQATQNGISSYTVILRSRSLEGPNAPLIADGCSYTQIGENKPYIINGKRDDIHFLQKDVNDFEKGDHQEILPIILNGLRSIVIY